MKPDTELHERLGVRPLINAAGTYTIVGGSRMSEETLRDMAAAARSHVMLRELQERVHQRLAELTKNDAAFVTPGAASGLYLCIGAAVSERFGKPLHRCSREEISDCEILVMAAHMNPYFIAAEQLGVRLRVVGYANEIYPIEADDIADAINGRTVAILYAHVPPGGWAPEGGLPFETVRDVARAANVRLLVDGAAQLPPRENFSRFTQAGADAVVFSGGKGLRGPQSSGLVLGRASYMDRVRQNGFPNYGFGRMLKVGREELVALWSAVEQFMRESDEQERERCEKMVARLVAGCDAMPGVSARRHFPNEAGQPLPRALVTVAGMNLEVLSQAMLAGDPGVFVNGPPDGSGMFLNPVTLSEDELDAVLGRIETLPRALRPT